MVVVKFQLNKNEEEKLNKVNLIFSRNVDVLFVMFYFRKKKKIFTRKRSICLDPQIVNNKYCYIITPFPNIRMYI